MVNPAAANEGESYFLLDELKYEAVSYWSPFDLLGRFISLTGPAPRGATRDNFYLPLTLMFINWCRKIAPLAPYVYSCVWAEQKDKQSRFHLGGSLAGYRNAEGQGNRWVKILQRARFNVLRDQRTDIAGIKFESTALKGRKGNFILFGNCAETYPLASVLRWVHTFEILYVPC